MRLIDHVRIEDPQFPAAIPCIVADEIARQLDVDTARSDGEKA